MNERTRARASNWEERYQRGEVRCPGSRGALKRWKWKVIDSYTGKMENRTVIDVGCGDARFWKGRGFFQRAPKSYTGIDKSQTALLDATGVIKNGTWFCQDSATSLEIEAEIVLCLDLIFHLLDEDTVSRTLENLCRYSTELIFIYTWVDDPSPYDESFQRFWNLPDFQRIFDEHNFKSLRTVNGRPRAYRSKSDKIGGMYIFMKVREDE